MKAQIAELGLADAIDWNLNLAAADIPRTIQAHHVMVLPYRESKKLGLLGQQRGPAAPCGSLRARVTSDARAFAEKSPAATAPSTLRETWQPSPNSC